MDPLSVTASIIAVLQLSAKVLGYLNDVKDASKDRAKCAVEASNVHSLLINLRFRLEEGNADAPWYTAVRALGVENGPLDQFKQALEALQTQMTDGGRLRQTGTALVWKFKKEEIAGILVRIEHLKTLVGIALQMDHL
jgi:GTP-sensing pleiotropic transcriptional regulator CodY